MNIERLLATLAAIKLPTHRERSAALMAQSQTELGLPSPEEITELNRMINAVYNAQQKQISLEKVHAAVSSELEARGIFIS